MTKPDCPFRRAGFCYFGYQRSGNSEPVVEHGRGDIDCIQPMFGRGAVNEPVRRAVPPKPEKGAFKKYMHTTVFRRVPFVGRPDCNDLLSRPIYRWRKFKGVRERYMVERSRCPLGYYRDQNTKEIRCEVRK